MPEAWEPFTPRGVARFAGATWARLAIVQLIVAGLTAAVVVLILYHDWFPVIRGSIQQMPKEGGLTNSTLNWQGENSRQLAQNEFLGIAVDLSHSGQLGRESHLQLELGQHDFRVYSLLGYQPYDYPPEWEIPVNKTDLAPWWGAWEPWIMLGAGTIVFVALLVSWTILATIYFIPVRILSFLENHDLSLWQSWKLSSAALLPGAFFLIAGLIAYGLNWMDVIHLGAILTLHFCIQWIYLLVSPFFCPRSKAAVKQGKNPFAAPDKKQ